MERERAQKSNFWPWVVVGQSASSQKKWQLVVRNLELVRKLRSRDGADGHLLYVPGDDSIQ